MICPPEATHLIGNTCSITAQRITGGPVWPSVALFAGLVAVLAIIAGEKTRRTDNNKKGNK